MLAKLWNDTDVRRWLFYIALATLILLAVAVPVLIYPSRLDEQSDLRTRLFSLEQKCRHLERENGKLRREVADLQSRETARDLALLEVQATRRAIGVPALTKLLALSPPQRQEIARLLAAFPNDSNNGDNDRQIWLEMEMREKIGSLLQPSQRQKYLSYLRQTGYGF